MSWFLHHCADIPFLPFFSHPSQVDTDTQWAYMVGFRDYFKAKKDYLDTQVGNPEGEDKPNKKYYDPRVWVREGEKTMVKRVQEAMNDLLTAGNL